MRVLKVPTLPIKCKLRGAIFGTVDEYSTHVAQEFRTPPVVLKSRRQNDAQLLGADIGNDADGRGNSAHTENYMHKITEEVVHAFCHAVAARKREQARGSYPTEKPTCDAETVPRSASAKELSELEDDSWADDAWPRERPSHTGTNDMKSVSKRQNEENDE